MEWSKVSDGVPDELEHTLLLVAYEGRQLALSTFHVKACGAKAWRSDRRKVAPKWWMPAPVHPEVEES